MNTKQLFALALAGLILVATGRCMAQTSQIAGTPVQAASPVSTPAGGLARSIYFLVVPPDFIGQPATTQDPSSSWIQVGTYRSLQDCQTGMTTVQMAQADDKGNSTVKAMPSNAACVPATMFEGPTAPNPNYHEP